MKQLKKDIAELNNNVRFKSLLNICEKYFGSPRQRGSHYIFKTPWQGDPRINIQEESGGKVKSYQVKQVRQALLKLLEKNE